MVSELAGEGAMPPQLPTPARRILKIAELRDRLRRGVTKRFNLFFLPFNLSVVLSKSSSWSRSVRNSSRVLVVAFSSWIKSMEIMSVELVTIYRSSRSRFTKRKSAELINRSSVAIIVPSPLAFISWSRSMKNSSRVLVNPLFIAFDCHSWSRSVEIDNNSSEEIEDKAENLDDDDGEELTAMNKIRRCRRFVFDDEEEQEEQKDEIDVVAAGTSTHIQKLRSAQMKLDLDVVSSGFVLSRASSASLGFSFTGFSKAFSENDQPEDSEKTSFNSVVQQHSSQ